MKASVIGVDVGTGSVRAGIYNAQGMRHGFGECDIEMHKPRPGWAEQSSANIWAATSVAVGAALVQSKLKKADIIGIGFDATCSLVLTGDNGSTLGIDGGTGPDVILWLDHRSVDDATQINATGDRMLRSVGGTISPEMQLPKLRWIKRNRPETWDQIDRVFDLTDWLTWKASGDDRRSLCTTVCKWAFDTRKAGHGAFGSWPASFFAQIGLAKLLENSAYSIGSEIVAPATPLGQGLTHSAAFDLGLDPGIAVATGLIDAHAGAAGIYMSLNDGSPLVGRLALIAGTSSCHMVLADQPYETPGVWGPYLGAIVPGLFLAEGGQSAAGAFLERLIASHPASGQLPENSDARYRALDMLSESLIAKKGLRATLGPRVIIPDFAGNRSPLARPELTGIIAGITLDESLEDLAAFYLAGLIALANSTRQIIKALSENGHRITSISATGSGAQNEFLMQFHADICHLPVVTSTQTDGVVLGAAMTAAVASGQFLTLKEAMKTMGRGGNIMYPNAGNRAFFDQQYRAFEALQAANIALSDLLG